jgi:hypothetical protein
VAKEVNGAIEVLVGHGLADDQNPAYVDRVGKNHYLVRYSNEPAFTAALRNRPYAEAYRELRLARSYNILMLDGAMLQMVYEFEDGDLKRHRLAFLPSPDLLEYQNNPELYEEELLYADVVDKGVVAVPLRFDFDCRPEVAVPLEHPISHLTLGQYRDCRIPVSAGVTPRTFVGFVLASFYHSASATLRVALPRPVLRFRACIDQDELQAVHINVPSLPSSD